MIHMMLVFELLYSCVAAGVNGVGTFGRMHSPSSSAFDPQQYMSGEGYRSGIS